MSREREDWESTSSEYGDRGMWESATSSPTPLCSQPRGGFSDGVVGEPTKKLLAHHLETVLTLCKICNCAELVESIVKQVAHHGKLGYIFDYGSKNANTPIVREHHPCGGDFSLSLNQPNGFVSHRSNFPSPRAHGNGYEPRGCRQISHQLAPSGNTSKRKGLSANPLGNPNYGPSSISLQATIPSLSVDVSTSANHRTLPAKKIVNG